MTRRLSLPVFAFLLLFSAWVGATAFSGAAQAEQEGVPVAQEHGGEPTHDAAPVGHDEHPEGIAEDPQEFNVGHGTDDAHGNTPGGHAEHSFTEQAIHAAEHVSFVDILLKAMGYHTPEEGQPDTNSPATQLIAAFQMPIISGVIILLLTIGVILGTRKREMIPGPVQNFVEFLVSSLDDFVQGILGPEGRHFVPFIGTLFIYIWVSNMIGIVPFFKSPTSQFNTTVALAICVFLYVQWTGVRRNGFGGYLYHLAGEPKDALGWGLVVLLFPLHVVGELAKPLSLSLRLFGNIFGEETLIAVFVGLGVAALAALHSPVGLPLHVPFLFLALLTSLIQAMVFALLSTIYFALMLPHHDHEHEEEHHHAG